MNYDKATYKLYSTLWGGTLRLIMTRPFFNKTYALFQRNKRSKRKIATLIEHYNIDTSEFIKQDFDSFNDFIIRELRPESRPIGEGLVAPADSLMLALEVDNDTIFSIKGKDYTISKLIGEENHEYGLCLIFRLAVYDYHRYCFPSSGIKTSHKQIRGVLDSVNMSQTSRFTLCSNCREVSVLQTESFGEIAFVEVGAMLVGRIVNTHKGVRFTKGDKKGYFEFGGSTIVLLLKKNAVKIKQEIIENSRRGIETKVKLGETISC